MDFRIACVLMVLIRTISSEVNDDPGECNAVEYLELEKPGTIQCCFNEDYYAITWYNTKDNEVILLYKDSVKSGDGYNRGEYDIHPNGSLVIQHVSINHETIFRVKIIQFTTGPTVRATYDINVKTIVHPFYPYPVIDACPRNTYICYWKIYERLYLNCVVKDSRPMVNLTWIAQSSNDYEDINYQTNVTRNNDNVTFSSRAIVRYPLENTTLLSLLICQSVGPSWSLEESSSVIMVENGAYSLPAKKPVKVFVMIGFSMYLQCSKTEIEMIVWKRSSLITNNITEVILFSVNLHDNHENITIVKAADFELGRNGSLILQHTKTQHEGLYFCIYKSSTTEDIIIYEVATYVNPLIVYMEVDGCHHQTYCVLEVQREGTLTCSINGIRPEVELEWKAYRYGSSVTFGNEQQRIKQEGDTFDISLTSTFHIVSMPGDRLTIECRVIGPYANLFKLSIKLDLLLTQSVSSTPIRDLNTVHPSALNNGTPNLLLIIIGVVAVLLLCILILLCIYKVIKYRRKGEGSEEENAPLQDMARKKSNLIAEMKKKYAILYESIQPIPYIKDKMYCVSKIFVESGIRYMKNGNKLSSYHDIINDNNSKIRITIIEGDPGYGKSTIALQLLHDWCTRNSHSPLKHVEMLIYLRLRQLKGIPSIIQAIKQFNLPKDTTLSESDIIDIVNNSLSLLILLDGYDEYPDQDDLETDMHRIIQKDMFQDAAVILTTRSYCVPITLPPQAVRTKLLGFGEKERDSYIRKAVVENDKAEVQRIKSLLKEKSVLCDFCEVPLFFVMFAHMSHDQADFKNIESVTSLFGYVISCLHSHMKNKMKDKNVSKLELFENEHMELDKLAYEALCGGDQKLVWEKGDLRKRLGHEFYDHYVHIGVLIEEENLDVNKVPIRYRTDVRFCHKIFCEWYAAHHLAEYIAKDLTIVDDDIYPCVSNAICCLDPFDLQYVYRFACGLNTDIAHTIINNLPSIKERKQFAMLCFLEMKENRKLQYVRELVRTTVIIRNSDSRLLQRSTKQLLEIASCNEIPIHSLCLEDSFKMADRNECKILLKSGITLNVCSSLRCFGIDESGKELETKQISDIIWVAAMCKHLESLKFRSCILPPLFKVDQNIITLQKRNVKVTWWSVGYTLNLNTGQWQYHNGNVFTDHDYQNLVDQIRRNL